MSSYSGWEQGPSWRAQLEDGFPALSGIQCLWHSHFLRLLFRTKHCLSCPHLSIYTSLCLSTYRVCWEGMIPTLHHHWAGREHEEVGEPDNWSPEDDLWEGWTSFSLDPLHQKGFEPQVVIYAQFFVDCLEPSLLTPCFRVLFWSINQELLSMKQYIWCLEFPPFWALWAHCTLNLPTSSPFSSPKPSRGLVPYRRQWVILPL